MRSNISVVNYSKSLRNMRSKPTGEGLVTYSWHSIWIIEINISKDLFDIKSCKNSKCTTQRKSSDPNFSSSKQSSQSLHIFPNITLDSLESIIESLMNQTSVTTRISYLSSIQISNPILNINFSFKSNNNCVLALRISCIAMDI